MKRRTGLILGIITAVSMLCAGCGKTEETSVAVQRVSMITGVGSVGVAERFSGITTARSETKVKADSQKNVLEVLVAVGDEVTEGQTLLTYDMEAAALTLEKAQLELDQMRDSLTSKEKDKETLEKEKEKAKAEEQLSYTLEIQACETEIREMNYNIALKEKEVARLEESLEVTELAAPISGRIKSLTDGSEYGSEANEFVIVESGTYRVKSNINENNTGSIMEGMAVIVRSRLDESVTWHGYVSMIDWENPASGSDNNNYFYGSDEMTSSSKFPFYVELDNADGLLLGQHVYIEPDLGQENAAEGLKLPEYYLDSIDGDSAVVWAENGNGRLEKRRVTLGAYDEELMSYEIIDGLAVEDYITMPDETLKEGLPCTEFDESAFEIEGGDEEGGFYGEGVYEENYEEEGFYGEVGTIEGEMIEGEMIEGVEEAPEETVEE